MRVHKRTIKKRVYQTLKVASNSTSVLCGKEGWEEENGARYKEGIYKDGFKMEL